MCQYRELFFSHKPIHQDSTGLVASAGCTGATTFSQAKIYWPECLAKELLYFCNPISDMSALTSK